jgi:dipeptidyl aminopeptidase/acylaminoacyl peptidase
VPYRFDNKGWIHDRHRHLWIVDAKGEDDPTRLTDGSFDEESPAWSSDGDRIAFISDRDPDQGLVSGNDVWEIAVSSGEVSQVTERGFWTFVSYRDDGALHLLGNTNPRYPVDSYLYRRESDGRLSHLTGHLDRSSVSLAAGPALIRWDGHVAVVGLEDSGTFGLVAVSPDGSVDTLVDGELIVTGFDKVGDRLVYTASTWDSPGELFSNGTATTRLNGDDDLELVEPERP